MFESTINKPIVLMQLSKREWKRYQCNSIHLKSSSIVQKGTTSRSRKVYYDDIEYGDSFVDRNSKKLYNHKCFSIPDEGTFHYNEIMLTNITKQFIMITCDID